jgi:aspartyl/asparaginyl beta-hydroxylase (cupin superfamily)
MNVICYILNPDISCDSSLVACPPPPPSLPQWLTCQMGIQVPDNESAYIQVGSEKRYWQAGQCLVYDTTYIHETKNTHATQDRVVLHIDFFNLLSMSSIEIEVMQYIYYLREEFMKAEGVAKVGAQLL